MKDIFKEFKPSSWAIDNRTSIFVVTVIIILAGIMSYLSAFPKEKFPDIELPTIVVANHLSRHFSVGYGKPGYTPY